MSVHIDEQRFKELFDQWAPEYDATVYDTEGEYGEVFEGYDQILETIVAAIPQQAQHILEFGVGTGNLSQKIVEKGYDLIGVEPSVEMRRQVTRKGLEIDLREGDFLHIPLSSAEKVDVIVSSFAFHHLPFEMKKKSIQLIKKQLHPYGKIIIADTVYKDKKAKQALHERVKKQGHDHLLHDLQTEYYELLPDIQQAFETEGFQFQAKQLNRFAWFMQCERGM